MRRFCFLLLAFLFPLQLFAGTLESVVADAEAKPAIVCSAYSHIHVATLPLQVDMAGMTDVADVAGDTTTAEGDQYATGNLDIDPDSKQLKVQADLEDQTLPAPFATLPLDWHPFPHLYPHVNDGTSAFIDLQRPPPSA